MQTSTFKTYLTNAGLNKNTGVYLKAEKQFARAVISC